MRMSRGGRSSRAAAGATLALALIAMTAVPAPADAAISNLEASAVAAVATTQFSGPVASFDSPGSGPFMVSIDWGDGSAPSSGTVTLGKTDLAGGTHTYTHEGSYSVVVTVTDESDKSSSQITATASVADAPIGVTASSLSLFAGRSFSGPVARITDPDTSASASAYSASIDWGDGTRSAGTVVANSTGGFDVRGDHTYASAGSYSAVVSIQDSGGSSARATFTATVSQPTPTAVLSIVTPSPSAGSPVTLSGAALERRPRDDRVLRLGLRRDRRVHHQHRQ